MVVYMDPQPRVTQTDSIIITIMIIMDAYIAQMLHTYPYTMYYLKYKYELTVPRTYPFAKYEPPYTDARGGDGYCSTSTFICEFIGLAVKWK